ncbi:uncharacterized protein LOC134832366 [Culicoides brevitarsis]|uniref:uncharacterized protein LOC134832366 n=1 Tax=Culicoides brevitarsis TaxID=469753 RepID=UPI00307CAABF
MGIKPSKHSESNENNNNKHDSTKSKKKRKWFAFSIKKQENKILHEKIRESQRRRSKRRRKLEPCQPTEAPKVLAPKPGTFNFQDLEKHLIERIKLQLQRDCQAFMLNQQLLSMQFYGNYQRERDDAFEEALKKEEETSIKMAKHSKSVLIMDSIQIAADKKVKYQASFGPIKGQLLTLDTQSIYIVCNNIDVTRADETDTLYGTLPDPSSYKMIMEDHMDQVRFRHRQISYRGYVKLRSVDFYDKVVREERSSDLGGSLSNEQVTMTPPTVAVDDVDGPVTKLHEDECDERFECESIYHTVDAKNVKNIQETDGKPLCIVNGLPFSASSSAETSRGSSEYDYSYITNISAHKPISSFVTNLDEKLSTTVLPSSCITAVVIDEEPSEGYESNNENSCGDEVDGASVKDEDEEPVYQLETRPYFSSRGFLEYFVKIFKSQIGPELGYEKSVLDQATFRGATIYLPCGTRSYEITPAIPCPWPNEAHEWDKRIREAIEDPRTKKSYQWPTQIMINRVIEMGCHVIPVGFAPKHGKNSDREIEWKVIFPLAERYLEQNFNAAQAKIYMILKTIFRAFVDPYFENGKNMFTKEHLKSFMFWQCEENPMAWTEDFLGEKLLKVLASLLHRIQTKLLPDYFLPKRNLFQNIPEKNLIQIQTRLSWICERPMNYLLIALRDLKFVKQFYPKLRAMKIYNVLVIREPLKELNPVFNEPAFNTPEEASEIKSAEVGQKPASRRPSEAVGSMADIEARTQALNRMKPSKNAVRRPRTSPNVIQRKKAECPQPVPQEPIDLKVNLCRRLEPARLRLLFDVYIPHFIELSQYALQVESATHVAQMAIRQAERLSHILYEQDDKGQKYLDQIKQVKQFISLQVKRIKLEGPSKPRRASLTGNRPRGLFSRGSSLIEDPYVNLSKVMNETTIKEEPPSNDETKNNKSGKLTIAAQVHVEKNITAEEIVQNAYRRHGMTQPKVVRT